MQTYESIYKELMEQINKEKVLEGVDSVTIDTLDRTQMRDDQKNMFNEKSVDSIYKNDIVILDNKQCRVIDVSMSMGVRNRKYLIVANTDKGEKVEKIFKKGDKLYIPKKNF